MDKMEIYNSARKAPPEALRKIAAGRLKGKSDINPMWRIKKLTELFGAAGIGWKFDPPVFEEKQGANGEVVVHCFTCLYIRQDEEKPWSAPIPGVGGSLLIAREQGGLRTDDDAYKKSLHRRPERGVQGTWRGRRCLLGGRPDKVQCANRERTRSAKA